MHVLFVHDAIRSTRVRTSITSRPVVNNAVEVGSALPWPGGIATAEIPRRYCSLSESRRSRPFDRVTIRIWITPIEVSQVNSSISSKLIGSHIDLKSLT